MTDNLAAYYTPESVAKLLADWAIVDSNSKVLDPSFGGCAFLSAALDRLHELGAENPGRSIYGVDIDPAAQTYLDTLYHAGATTGQFVQADFFEIAPQQLSDNLFDTILGNPPYIRYHSIPEQLHKRATERLESYGIKISGRASYWAFFLLYSIQFLKPGGRLAMILPGALLHTDYAFQIRELITRSFANVTIYLLEERIFQNTEEESVLICAEGAHAPHQAIRIGNAANVDGLKLAFADLKQNTHLFESHDNRSDWLTALVKPETFQLYSSIAASPHVIRTDEWLSTRIGVVTGNNNYFILSSSEWSLWKLSNEVLKPIVRKAIHLNGLWVTDQKLDTASAKSKGKYLLFSILPNQLLDEASQQYIAYGEKKGVNKAAKCQRKPWYVVPQTSVPPAFLPIMSASWPRIIVNQSHYTCTNNILKLYWNSDRPASDWLRLALGSLSTIAQLSAELVGRSYGGGVLKLEPKEFASLIIPLLPEDIVVAIAPIVDKMLTEMKYGEATALVDRFLVEAQLGFSASNLNEIRSARDMLFLRRRQHRNDARKVLALEDTR